MSKLTKNQKAVLAKYDKTQVYSLPEACTLLKEITYTKFDASVEITTNLRHAEPITMSCRRN